MNRFSEPDVDFNKRRRYDARTGRTHHMGGDYVPYNEREFIFWDGEGTRDAGFCLFGSSKGHRVRNENGLTSEQVFDLLIQAKLEYPYSIFVIYAGLYDWDETLRGDENPETCISRRALVRLKKDNNIVKWRDYRLSEIERKIYTVKKRVKDELISVQIHDVFGWFTTSFENALTQWKIGPWGETTEHDQYMDSLAEMAMPLREKIMTAWQDVYGGKYDVLETPDIKQVVSAQMELKDGHVIRLFKHDRNTFMWDDIDLIDNYMGLELKWGVVLMERVREEVIKSGYDPTAWYGPSNISSQRMRKMRIPDCMAECPEPVQVASQYAFSAGMFDNRMGGVLYDIEAGDINSAFPWAMTKLPDLSRGHWRHITSPGEFEPGSYGMWKIHKISPPSRMRSEAERIIARSDIFPLFRRDDKGRLWYPEETHGWFWTPDAELVADYPYTEFREGWVFEPDTDYKPFWWVAEMYKERKRREKQLGKLAAFPDKLAMNAIHGHLCRRVGWEKKKAAPPFHQLEWDGYITSLVKAEVYKVGKACGNRLISMNADAVIAACNLNVPAIGGALGEWDVKKYDKGVFIQSGFYALHSNQGWETVHARGMQRFRGKFPVDPDELCERIGAGDLSPVKGPDRDQFYSLKMELLRGKLETRRHWVPTEGKVYKFGGEGSRYHPRCQPDCSGTEHVFIRNPTASGFSDPRKDLKFNAPRILPWKLDSKGQKAYIEKMRKEQERAIDNLPYGEWT